MKRILFAILLSPLALHAQSVFNCTSFDSSTGPCGANTGSGPFKVLGGHNSITGSNQLQLAPAHTSHTALAANYTTPVNVQAFSTTYTFIPSGNVLAFVLQNVNNQAGYEGTSFVAGAGCEGGFFQASNVGVGGQSPNNVFAITMDGFNYLTPGDPNFTYSGTALYQADHDPCKPNDGDPVYNPVNNISTSPVALNSPVNTPNTTTGHTYSVTITYDGSNVTESLFDVTAGGSCPGSSCFTHTWTGINIPSIVGGSNTALAGITASTISAGNAGAVLIDSWSYTEGSATVATPTFSPAAGSYTSAQSVTISDSTSGAVIYYTTDGTTPTTSSAVYSGPITVSTTETLEAIAGESGDTNSAVASATYTISQGTTATPTISLPTGTYSGPQTVTITDSTSGSTIHFTTDGSKPNSSSPRYTGPITVSTSETLKAMATSPGNANSLVATSVYTITGGGTVAEPTFSLIINDATSGATIYYTTDGSTPTTSSLVYSGPITVTASETVKTLAALSGLTNSAVDTVVITIP